MLESLRPNCEDCFALCCVALPYAKSADFACDKESGVPCRHLQGDYRCGIHANLRTKGFRGCTVYECFGAGQHVSQTLYGGRDWREDGTLAQEMFDVFPLVQQLYEMMYYLQEAQEREETKSFHAELAAMFVETSALANLQPVDLLAIDVHAHRAKVNVLLLRTSECVRAGVVGKQQHKVKNRNLLGANIKGADLRGSNLRGALLIAANAEGADLRMADFIGADLRDTNIRGADLREAIFVTQVQINAANGSTTTKLPKGLRRPSHWS